MRQRDVRGHLHPHQDMACGGQLREHQRSGASDHHGARTPRRRRSADKAATPRLNARPARASPSPTSSDTCNTSSVVEDSDTSSRDVRRHLHPHQDLARGRQLREHQRLKCIRPSRCADTTAPTIGGQGSDATIECPASPSFTSPTSSDTCNTSSSGRRQRYQRSRDVRRHLHADQDMACGR